MKLKFASFLVRLRIHCIPRFMLALNIPVHKLSSKSELWVQEGYIIKAIIDDRRHLGNTNAPNELRAGDLNMSACTD